MKKVLVFLFLTMSVFSAFAYDFRQIIFGNHYENIIEITNDKKIKELTSELEPLIEYYNSKNGYYTIHGGLDPLDLEFYKLYEETYNNGTIYRMLRYEYDGGFANRDNIYSAIEMYYLEGLYQFVFIKADNKIKCLGVYEVYEFYGDGGYNADITSHRYKNFSTISKDNYITAFLLENTINSEVDYFRENRIDITRKSEGYWLYFDKNFMAEFSESIDFEKESKVIYIEASFPLIDKDRPFMYTLHNAFDGDARTSFVEDTENNMFYLKLSKSNGDLFECSSIKLINGYASSDRIYKLNNRIKTIKSDKGDFFTCNDQNLSYQNSLWSSSQLIVDSIYNGDSYSDTCLAELDFLIKNEDLQEHWFVE